MPQDQYKSNATRAAFEQAIEGATQAAAVWLSLYVEVPYYGGPEEGGWWGEDVHLVFYKQFPTAEAAEAALESVKTLAKTLSHAATVTHGEQCLKEMDWLDARGLDADFLPEVDGEEKYFAVVEEDLGELAYKGDRYYS